MKPYIPAITSMKEVRRWSQKAEKLAAAIHPYCVLIKFSNDHARGTVSDRPTPLI
jgi:hypothetical protein